MIHLGPATSPPWPAPSSTPRYPAGGYLYDGLGYTALVPISTAFTAVGWFLVPLVKIDRIELRAQAVATEAAG